MSSTAPAPGASGPQPRDAQGGAAGVLIVCWMALLLLVAGAAVTIADIYRVRAASVAAADLAALAGAGQLLSAGTDPCGQATAAASRNGAVLRSCRAVGDEVTVEVAVRMARGPLRGTAIAATARSQVVPK